MPRHPTARFRQRCSYRSPHSVSPIEPHEFGGRDLDFVLIAKREEECCDERAKYPKASQPPDVPDQGKAADDGKKGSDEADRAVFWHLDRLVRAYLLQRISFGSPEGVARRHLRQHGEIPR